ncbi:MAG: DNA polymerase III subunit beta [Elusimicrobia bacterium]|nr:DNA polymerase III subunit beta [Elusimicrobiota bacterium]
MQTIQSALSPRTTLPILLNFLLETEKSRVKLVSTDLEMGMKHYIPAEVESDGSITIPARKFNDIIASLQDGVDVDLTVDAGGKVQLKSGRSRFSIIGSPKSEYPVLPEFSQENAFSMPASMLAEMLRKTIFAASSDETRYVLNGVFWVANKGTLDLVSTDGRRLAIIRRKCLPENMDFKVIVPTKILHEVLKLVGSKDAKGDEKIKIGLDSVSGGHPGNQLAFQYQTTTLLSRLVEGSFPNYEQVIPTKKGVAARASAEDLGAITKRAALCAADRGGAVRYTFKPGSLHVHASSQNMEFDDEIPLDYKGDDIVIAFNPQFILEGLKSLDSDKVVITLTSPSNPALMEADGDTAYQYVVMPMRA